MRVALSQFQSSIQRARDLVGLAQNLSRQTTGALDVSDLLRASLVASVSALDYLIHELARKGMLEIAAGRRPHTDAYLRFAITMDSVAILLSNPSSHQVLEDEIRERHGWLSFQDPAKIADALRLVSSKDLWKDVGSLLGISSKDAKDRLKLIINRRNQIAHEADMDPTLPGARWPIDSQTVEDAIVVIEQTGSAIVTVIVNP